jgi:hypothetical protein
MTTRMTVKDPREDGDDDSMEDDEDEDEVLQEDNGWGQEEEDTNFLHLLNRSVKPPLPLVIPPNPSDTLFD